jgi:hypothetical protein
MVFQVQPSSKRIATIGYRKKKGVPYHFLLQKVQRLAWMAWRPSTREEVA